MSSSPAVSSPSVTFRNLQISAGEYISTSTPPPQDSQETASNDIGRNTHVVTADIHNADTSDQDITMIRLNQISSEGII